MFANVEGSGSYVLNPVLTFFENTVDPDQLLLKPSDQDPH